MENLAECDQPPEIIDALKEMLKTAKGFIVMAGKNGTGKTYAAKCVYNVAIHPLVHPQYNHDIAVFSTQAELNLLLEKKRHMYGETWSFLEEIRKAKLMVLDDIGTRTPTEAFMDFLYSIIDYRHNSNLATIITTNRTASELRQTFGDAFVSRISCGKCFRFEGKDRRFNEF
jgi:DNA replication protein DnaC